jgi:hypothetical protein
MARQTNSINHQLPIKLFIAFTRSVMRILYTAVIKLNCRLIKLESNDTDDVYCTAVGCLCISSQYEWNHLRLQRPKLDFNPKIGVTPEFKSFDERLVPSSGTKRNGVSTLSAQRSINELTIFEAMALRCSPAGFAMFLALSK